MIRRKSVFCALLFAAIVTTAIVPAHAQPNVNFIGAGSSAMWQIMAIAAFNNLAGPGAHHFTVKGNCTSGPCGFIDDSQRSSSIANEGGNLWIVWDSTQSNVWAYISVDSVVGVRSFMATPRTTLDIDADAMTGVPGSQTNLISSALWGADDATVPATIYNALNFTTITAGMTDIRPEDAYYASCRAMGALDTTLYEGLGYGSGCNGATLVGTQIKSAFTAATANPVEFVLDGNADPFSGNTVPASTTIAVGAAPILFLINKTNAIGGLGATSGGNPVFKNIATTDAQNIFNGNACDGNAFNAPGAPPDFPVHVMLREPLSGTMNTTEFTVFRTQAAYPNTQENGIDPSTASGNPLNQACASGGGDRKRGIGTGEIVGTAVHNTADSVGYAFFSYGNVSSIAGTTNYGYLTLDGVDGLNSSYTNGQLPTCPAPAFCPATPGSSYPHLRDGTYTSWSVVRAVTDASGPNLTNLQALVTAAQAHINEKVPDFVPFVATPDGDPGLTLYRSHFTVPGTGIAPNNGLGASPEAGGDVGGCIRPKSDGDPGILECRQ